jgi:hypothetical protein
MDVRIGLGLGERPVPSQFDSEPDVMLPWLWLIFGLFRLSFSPRRK